MNRIKKVGVYLLMLLFSAMIGALYGAVHDQISYTVSPEYFSHLKFEQFGVWWGFQSPRLGAAAVGALATWWMGVLVSLLLGLAGFRFVTAREMGLGLAKSVVVVTLVALATGILGLIYGFIVVNEQSVISYMGFVPEGVTNPVRFVQVGLMHNASYLGGLTGLIAGVFYLRRLRRSPP